MNQKVTKLVHFKNKKKSIILRHKNIETCKKSENNFDGRQKKLRTGSKL